MARFLTNDDYKKQIKTEILNAVTQDQASTLPECENAAMEEVEGYLAQHYDMGTAWAATGSNRNPLLVMYLIDITLYHLHSSIPSRQIPQLRYDRYMAAKDYFERAASGNVTLKLPRIPDTAPGRINTGATLEISIMVPAATGDTAAISINGINLFPTLTLTASDLSGTAEAICAAINANKANTAFSAIVDRMESAGDFRIILPAKLGHLGNNLQATITTTGSIQMIGGTSYGGRTQDIGNSLNPERMRIGSHGRRFESDF